MAELSRQSVADVHPRSPTVVVEGRLVIVGVGCGVRRGRFGLLPCAVGYASTFRYAPIAVTSHLMSAPASDIRS